MVMDLQIRIKNDPMLKNFLRENSYWYKSLNRDPSTIKNVINDMKEKYELKPIDRINKLVDNINLMQSFLEAFKN